MPVHKKLMEARIKLQNTKLEKSGHNKFAGYTYFELGDFLPTVQQIFQNVGLCGVVSYATDVATLTITDIEDGTTVAVTSPMAEANLKGCHPIQNLGAVETYTRRYLWVTAMEIVEHDALDSTTGKDEPQKKGRLPTLTDEQAELAYNEWAEEKRAFIDENGIADNEALTRAWGAKTSNVRSAIKRYFEMQSQLDKEASQHLRSI